MYMTDEEIYKMWKHSKHKTKEIGILADLNLCTRKDIKEAIEIYEARKAEEQRIDRVSYIKDVEKRLDELDSLIFSATQEYKQLAQILIKGA